MGLFSSNRKKETGELPVVEPQSPNSTRDARVSKDAPPIHTRQSSVRYNEPSKPTREISTKEKKQPPRPEPLRRRTTAQTQYLDMLLQQDTIPRLHNLLATFFTWITLAGYIVFPATFTSLSDSQTVNDIANKGRIEAQVLSTVRNAPLLYIAAFCCGIGILGCIWLWWKHRGNYVWLINRIFLATFMNSLTGLISTLINVYSAQSGQYSVTARATTVVTAAVTTVGALLFLLYNSWLLTRVKKRHQKETATLQRDLEVAERQRSGEGEKRRSWFERLKRQAEQPGRDPESVV